MSLPDRTRAPESSLTDVLDWWRVYVAIAAGLAAAGCAVWWIPSLVLSEMTAGLCVLAGIVAGLLWQARRS